MIIPRAIVASVVRAKKVGEGIGSFTFVVNVVVSRLHREALLFVVNTSLKLIFFGTYVSKTHILTCILKHLNSSKVPRATILSQNVLKRQILTDLIL